VWGSKKKKKKKNGGGGGGKSADVVGGGFSGSYGERKHFLGGKKERGVFSVSALRGGSLNYNITERWASPRGREGRVLYFPLAFERERKKREGKYLTKWGKNTEGSHRHFQQEKGGKEADTKKGNGGVVQGGEKKEGEFLSWRRKKKAKECG